MAAVPEGLAVTVTIALAAGARRMAARRAIVRNLAAVETLGSATVIATDKTGTLTQNRLDVAEVDPTEGHSEADVLVTGALATAAPSVRAATDRGWVGDPVDVAFVERAYCANPPGRRVATVPFDPERRRITVAYMTASGIRVVVKGAPEVLADRAGPHTSIAEVFDANRRLASQGHRVLAVGEQWHDAMPDSMDKLDDQIDLVGLVALADPLREDTAESVQHAREAGLDVLMVTGDQSATAAGVAALVGLPSAKVTHGGEMARMSDDEVRHELETSSVFARVTPADKLRLVAALQSSGEVVAVTGDGVNDTPALRRADVGVAMGQAGAEAAREAADIVLTDDAFSTIVAAIEEGRRIGQNVRAFTTFLLSANAGEVMLFAAAILGGAGAPLTVVQILTVNLLTDGLPAVALTQDPPSPDLMRQPPRSRLDLFGDWSMRRLGALTVLVAGAAAAAYAFDRTGDTTTRQTMAYATLALAELFLVFSVRHATLPAWRLPRNRLLEAANAASMAILAATIYLPWANDAFGTTPLEPLQLVVVAALAILPCAASESWKHLRRRRG